MEIHRIQTLPHSLPTARRVVALGAFDGVHLGHRAVITTAASLLEPARVGKTPMRLSVFCLCGLNKAPCLCNEETQYEQLSLTGAHELLETEFEAVRTLSPEAFVCDFLRDTLHAEAVVCGFNFRFGHQASGDAAILRRLCAEQGITVRVVEPVTDETGEAISSTRIRALLAAGDMPTASRLLGYPFTLHFPVVHGQHLGNKLGFPTINQPLPADFIAPRLGVYASAVIVDGHVTYGVTNIGTHPTVGQGTLTAETWIPDFNGDLYGKHVPVTPIQFLREECVFPSLEALSAQVKADAVAAKKAVMGNTSQTTAPAHYGETPIRAVFFDFDDTLQNRFAAFLGYAKALMEWHFPHLSKEEKERRAQWMLTENNGGQQLNGTPLDYPAFFEQVAGRWSEPLPTGEQLLKEYPFLFSQYTTLFADALATLRTLREKGLLLGVITNGAAVMQLQKLDHSGIRPLLDVTVVSGVHGIRKPQKELFLRAAAYAGVAPEQCLFVGDHPICDLKGSAEAGMHPIYLDAFEKYASAETVRITSPQALLSLLN